MVPSRGSMHHRYSEAVLPLTPPSSPSRAWSGNASLSTCPAALTPSGTAENVESSAHIFPEHHQEGQHGRTESTASSLALSVSVTRSVVPLNCILRGLSTASLTTWHARMHCHVSKLPMLACYTS